MTPEEESQIFIEAIYEPTNAECFVSLECIIDLFVAKDKPTKYRAYTIDNERGGYLIDKTDVDKFLIKHKGEEFPSVQQNQKIEDVLEKIKDEITEYAHDQYMEDEGIAGFAILDIIDKYMGDNE